MGLDSTRLAPSIILEPGASISLLKSGNRDLQAAAALFQAGKTLNPQTAADLDLAPSYKVIALTALAQAYPESAPELIRLAQGLNTGFAFPRHLLDRALTALGPKR